MPSPTDNSVTSGRRLCVLLDGTSNAVAGDATNVLKLYRMLEKRDDQLVFYQPGVGTISLTSDWARLPQKALAILGLATGWGLDRNILAGYDFLARNWREGDTVHLFGFSRGAYTARALAGFIHMLGLVRPEQLNLAPYALSHYKRVSDDDDLPSAFQFQRVIDSRRVTVDFIGVFDTVASILVPRQRGLLPAMSFLPYTKMNPSVRVFREALAIDERRRMFRPYRWRPDQRFKRNPFGKRDDPQDQQSVWFAGSHGDIGGGYPEAESQAAKHALLWMVDQAAANGLKFRSSMVGHLARGKVLPGGRRAYVAPDVVSSLHKSLSGAWHILEWLPKKLKWRRWPLREAESRKGWYLPRGEPRSIADGDQLHRSVQARVKATDYRPINLLARPIT